MSVSKPAVALGAALAAVAVLHWRRAVTALQRRVGDGSGGRGWANLGLGGGCDFAARAEALAARVLGDVPAGARILSVGCGRGAELEFLLRTARARCVDGLDSAVEGGAARFLTADGRVRLRRGAARDVGRLARPGAYDVVVSIDAAYHFGDFAKFLRGARRVLAPGGALRLSHVVGGSAGVRLLLRAVGDVRAFPTEAALARAVVGAGFEGATVDRVSGVLGRWGLGRLGLRYVALRAVKPGAAADRPRVAVVGAGVAGLAAAFQLSASHDVTVFEAAADGFARNGVAIAGAVVDVPLRMIGQGYYDALEALCDDAGVGTPPARGKSQFRF